MRIYIDESGNLGGIGAEPFTEDPYFVLVALVANQEIPIKRCIKNVRMTLKKKYRAKSEIKFKDSDSATKRRILKCIAETDNDIIYVLFRKDQSALLRSYLNVGPQSIVNDLYKQLLWCVILSYNPKAPVKVVIDRFLYGDSRNKFDSYLITDIERDIHISHMDSKQCPCLQAVDFVAGAIARKYRDNDDQYYNVIRHKITKVAEFTK